MRGLLDCLEEWAVLTERLRAKGSRLLPAEETLRLSLPPRLEGTVLCGDPAGCARQRAVWRALLRGERPDPNMVWWSSKFRNPGSLRVRLTYAGRRIELSGDCYGAVWEGGAERCDVWKVPHHGDAKSVTPLLVRRLRPEHAVISCQAEYIPRKDRPSPAAVRLLEEQGAQVWFTDSFAWGEKPPACRQAVIFTIAEDGAVLSPSERERSSQEERMGAGRS